MNLMSMKIIVEMTTLKGMENSSKYHKYIYHSAVV